MEEINKKYESEDFLRNEKFIEWQILQTEELNDYWESFLRLNPDSHSALFEAIDKFKIVKLNDYRLGRKKSEILLQKILKETYLKSENKRKLFRYIGYAATIAVLIFSTWIYTNYKEDDKIDIDHSAVGWMLPDKEIQLISGASVIPLTQNTKLVLSDEGALSIEPEEVGDKRDIMLAKDSYSKLVVPYGKQSTITLADGTKAWINAGTKLEFPSEFKGNTRKIRVDGEVYLEVMKDEKRPFLVEANGFEIKVLGTRFNVSTYNDDEDKHVVLVDGAVEVKVASNNPILLKPNQLLQIKSKETKIQEVDVLKYISWKDGYLIFDKMAYNTILSKIEKHYNVSFKRDKTSDIFTQTYSGRLILSDDIDDVMNSLSTISSTVYNRENNIFYINKKQN